MDYELSSHDRDVVEVFVRQWPFIPHVKPHMSYSKEKIINFNYGHAKIITAIQYRH